LKKLFLKLVAKDKAKAVEILGDFGVAKLTEIAEDKYPEAYAAIDKALQS